MNDSTLKKYLIGSITAHFLIIITGLILSHSTTIRHTFVVLGAHSKMPHKTLLKQFENRTGAGAPGKAGTHAQGSRLPERKQIAKKVVSQPKKAPVKKNVGKPAVKRPPAKLAPGVALDTSKRVAPEKKKAVPTVQKKQVVNKKPDVKLDKKIDKKIVEHKKAQEKIPEQKIDKKELITQAPVKKELVSSQPEPCKQLESEGLSAAAQKSDELVQGNFQSEDGEQFFVGQTDQDNVVVAFTDREMLLYQRVVQQEIERTWQPPLGVPKGTECTVRFEIADNGNIKSVILVHRSDVLIFDLSTLRSARKCMFAQCLWGKIFQVDFRQ